MKKFSQTFILSIFWRDKLGGIVGGNQNVSLN